MNTLNVQLLNLSKMKQ